MFVVILPILPPALDTDFRGKATSLVRLPGNPATPSAARPSGARDSTPRHFPFLAGFLREPSSVAGAHSIFQLNHQ